MSFWSVCVAYGVVSAVLRINAYRYFIDRPDIKRTQKFFGKEADFYSEGAGQRAFRLSEGFARAGGLVLLCWLVVLLVSPSAA